MAKTKLQTVLVGLSVTSASINLVGLLLSSFNLSTITTGVLTPTLVAFGFFQSMLVVTNHLRQ